MKDNFSCALNGAQWWKPFLGFLILFLAVVIPYELAAIKMSGPGAENIISTLLFLIVMIALMVILQAAFAIILCRIVYPTISVKNETFKFFGDIGGFIKLNLVGVLLSIVTIGFYFPWYTKKIADYVAVNSEFRGEKAAFQGKAGKLLKYYLLALCLPVLVWLVLFGVLIWVTIIAASSSPWVATASGILAAVVYISIFFVIMPFLYLSYKWFVDIKWKDSHVSWKTEFWPSIFFLAGQTLLSIITIGIYLPAFCIKAYRYFIGKTIIETDGKEVSHLGFEGKTGTGFGLLWGQMLLSMLTLGIYLPWAYANCIRFFINNTFVEDKQVLISQ